MLLLQFKLNKITMDEEQRAAALMRQRMAQTNGRIPMGAPPAPRQVRFNPNMQRTPHQSMGELSPKRSPNPPVSKVTGSGPLIPPKSDPLNKYENIEKATGEPIAGDSNSMAVIFAKMIIVALLVSSIFVIPPAFKVFWIMIVSIIVLVTIGFILYYEWDYKANKASTSDDDKTKYSGWASTMLYTITMAYTAVAAAILAIMVWRIYSMVNSKSNLISDPPSEKETVMVEESSSVDSDMGDDGESRHHRHHKKKKRNKMPFV